MIWLLALCAPAGAPLSRRQLLLSSACASTVAISAPPRAHASVNFDMSRYGDRELQVATLNRLKQSIRNAAAAEPQLLPGFLEAALSDALQYRRADASGGLDGSVRFDKLGGDAERAVVVLKGIQTELQRQTEVTFADLVAYAGAQAIEVVGGPKIPVQLGREDATAKAATPALDWSALSGADLRAAFTDAGLSSRELVLMAGALGAVRRAARATKARKPDTFSADADDLDDPDASGYIEPTTSFLDVKPVAIDVRRGVAGVAVDAAAAQPLEYLKALASASSAPADDAIGQALLSDEEWRALVAKYATNQKGFMKDVGETYQALTLLGKKTNTRKD